ncbi:glycerotoxin paralog 1-like isoform X2 [Branchiostoma floridae x Branchiostoma japonicum]
MVTARGSRYVPYLAQSVYFSMLDDYYREANVFRDEYNRALDRTESVEVRLEAARRLLAKQNDIIQLQEQDLQDMATELEVAKETRKQMKARLDESNTKLDQAKVDFERGIEEYRQEQAAQAAFGFIGAIFGIFIGVIQIGLGDVVGGVSNIVGSTIDIADTITDLTILIRDLEEYNSIADDAVESAAGAVSGNDYEGYILSMERVVELHIKVVEWDNLQNVASALLGHGEVTKISGSREYRKIMSETSNWGKALTETTIAEAELRVQYESRKRWLAAEKREKERIEAQIGIDESRREISLELTSAIGLTAFHVKLELNNILLDYCNSYFYFQFQECGSTYKPNLGDDLVTLLDKVSNAAQDGLQNLASFNPPPQPFNNLNIRITDSPTACVNATECPVSLLKETRRLHVEIRHDHPNFLSWDRVRIEKIRVFLIGATLPSNRMRVSISTSGEFFDRYRSIEQDFVSVPLRRGFEYNPSSNGVIVDGNIHDDFHGYYSLTTPFTTWVIDVSTGLNTGLDLSRLSRVELHMWGSLVSGSRDGQVLDNMVIDL